MQLQIEVLWEECFTDNDVLDALDNLPEDLNATYSRCLDRIRRHRNGVRFAPKVLTWVGYAIRPLHIDELREAVAFEFVDNTYDPGKIPLAHTITNCCANLVVLDPFDCCVRFAHPSVKQYLLANWQKFEYPFYVQEKQGELSCGELCVNYLSFSDFGYQLQRRPQAHVAEVTNPLPGLLQFPLSGLVSSAVRLTLYKRTQPKRTIQVHLPTLRPTGFPPDSGRYKFLPYATQYWALGTKSISRQSIVWDYFKDLALRPEAAWKIHPWTSSGQSVASHLHGLLGWATLERHIPLLEIVLSMDPGSRVSEFCNLPCIEGGLPALHVASRSGHEDVVALLLSICSVNALDNESCTALHHAAVKGHLNVVKLLLAVHGVTVDAVSESYQTPLMLAAASGEEEIVTLLLRMGANCELKDWHNVTPLSMAVRSGHANVVKLLLKLNVDVNAVEDTGASALHFAASRGEGVIARMLLSARPSLDTRDRAERTALHQAVLCRKPELVEMLVEAGAATDLLDDNGDTPLMIAVNQLDENIAHLLLEHGADVEMRQPNEVTVLTAAARTSQLGIFKMLLEKGACLDVSSDGGITPLTTASRYNYVQVVEIILQKLDEEKDATELHNKTLGMTSTTSSQRDERMLKKMALINAPEKNDGSALQIACVNGHTETARLLLNNGAGVDIDGPTHTSSVLIGASSYKGVSALKGAPPLIHASARGHSDIVDALLSFGADVNFRHQASRVSALIVASKDGHLKIVEKLVQNGAEVNAKDQYGLTALHYATEAGHDRVANRLLEAGAENSLERTVAK